MTSYVLVGLVAIAVVVAVVALTAVTARAVAGAVDRSEDSGDDLGVPWLLFLVCSALIGPVACVLGVRVVVALVNSVG